MVTWGATDLMKLLTANPFPNRQPLSCRRASLTVRWYVLLAAEQCLLPMKQTLDAVVCTNCGHRWPLALVATSHCNGHDGVVKYSGSELNIQPPFVRRASCAGPFCVQCTRMKPVGSVAPPAPVTNSSCLCS